MLLDRVCTRLLLLWQLAPLLCLLCSSCVLCLAELGFVRI